MHYSIYVGNINFVIMIYIPILLLKFSENELRFRGFLCIALIEILVNFNIFVIPGYRTE